MPFFNREEDIKRIKAVLSGEPNLVYFVYGPINSGKTALLTRVFEELPEEYVIFYFNFRGLNIQEIDDLIRVLFEVEYGKGKEAVKDIIKEILKKGINFMEEVRGIPIPEKIFDYFFENKKSEDVFRYLENLFREVVRGKKRPILVFDEMQTIKKIVNTTGKPLLEGLFNFMVRMTKETHLCHSFCATSDCLFIEDVYSNARLEGRARYILVDDLSKEKAVEVYEAFGFEEKELVWEYIGGKIGDMVILFEEKKQGYDEREALERMLKNERGRIKWILREIEEGEKEGPEVEKIKEVFKIFAKKEVVSEEEIKGRLLRFLIQENVLFYNPVEGTVRPQSRLLWRAIREVI